MTSVLPWPEFPASGERIAFLADGEGRIARVLGAGEYEAGVAEQGGAYVISVQGEPHTPPGGAGTDVLSKVELRVEHPARATRDERRSSVFVRLMHRDD